MQQDIHLRDKDLWIQFYSYWNEEKYQEALDVLNNNTQLTTKYFGATVINAITEQLTDLQNNIDPTFKQNKIITSPTAPAGMQSGEVYFKEI